ncbi:mutator MutT protein [Oleiphilus messinensis]|uniref:8-oxo-dGTP diphosphatase n=1 Tax=Oleiphilus messinensis TaxID=141451 RepID=A0A1Y0IE11_9GAMM|nr:Nudix family hydrolase [Oleiphilus messinensis]ARU58681.1 mutator MutT protein [Oleiphilus messinensis]
MSGFIDAHAKKRIHVAVGVVERDGLILLAKRPDHVHQGGLWEFPGGKVEQGETVEVALVRELSEELGIQANPSALIPLIQIHHDYSDKLVCLDVWRVPEFFGHPQGVEGQPVEWVPIEQLGLYQFPQANVPIIAALQLPQRYLITGSITDPEAGFHKLKAVCERAAIKLVRVRRSELTLDDYGILVMRFGAWCQQAGVHLMIDFELFTSLFKQNGSSAIDSLLQNGISGVHLRSRELLAVNSSESNEDEDGVSGALEAFSAAGGRLAASCHNKDEIEHAESSGMTFVVLSPIEAARSHDAGPELGWNAFRGLVAAAKLPVYALGGMTEASLEKVISFGGQGISAVSEWWHGETR